ncbi:MAG TPA: prepilin-type N-terminal cleavage/methylation domain-containing protein [Syntrophales bacterium]|jgi:type IV pilus assembly protein PilV
MTANNQNGFSLVETTIAMSLLVVAILGIAAVIVMMTSGNDFSRRTTVAATMAKDKIEEIKNTNYQQIATGGPETGTSIYTREWTVTSDVPDQNMKTIIVTVKWPWQGKERSVSLKTIIASTQT